MKLFVTGDLHIGKKYDRYTEIKESLIQSRFDCLKRCVSQAEKEHCDFLVITGDLFDNVYSIKIGDVKKIVETLMVFDGRIIILPGNHDYYTGEEKVWKDFKDALSKVSHNITLVTEFKELRFDDVGEESITFYPAFCQSKHAEKNNLDWIKSAELDDSTYHVGLAHGALAGLSPDMKNEYFLMTEKELNGIPMDAWFIGHTHIPYPSDITDQEDVTGYRIYNAGTPEQTDLSNNTPGTCFIVTLLKEADKTVVAAHAYQSGGLRYFDLRLQISGNDLRSSLLAEVQGLQDNAILRLTLSGSIPGDQYTERYQIYEETLARFMTYEITDDELYEQITHEKIRSEFAEIGFAAKLLDALADPKELQMAYELIRKYQV